MRGQVNKHIDAKHFTRTASHTKAINLGQIVFRGGIRF